MGGGGQRTTVRVSIQTMNGSAVRYRESLRPYSFQSCAKRYWELGMVLWLRTK